LTIRKRQAKILKSPKRQSDRSYFGLCEIRPELAILVDAGRFGCASA
jgi:hypothetical protein